MEWGLCSIFRRDCRVLFLDRTFYCTLVSTLDIPRCLRGLYT